MSRSTLHFISSSMLDSVLSCSIVCSISCSIVCSISCSLVCSISCSIVCSIAYAEIAYDERHMLNSRVASSVRSLSVFFYTVPIFYTELWPQNCDSLWAKARKLIWTENTVATAVIVAIVTLSSLHCPQESSKPFKTCNMLVVIATTQSDRVLDRSNSRPETTFISGSDFTRTDAFFCLGIKILARCAAHQVEGLSPAAPVFKKNGRRPYVPVARSITRFYVQQNLPWHD